MAELVVDVIFQDIKTIESDAIVVGFYEDVRPLKSLAGHLDWLLCGSLSRLIVEKRLSGALGEMALLNNRSKIPAEKIFLVGLGPQSAFSCSTLKSVAMMTAASISAIKIAVAALEYFPPADADYETAFRALQEGLKEGAGEHNLAVSLVALDRVSYDRISRLL